jgi:hypothetical protein
MTPLGIGLGVGAVTWGDDIAAIEDYYWEKGSLVPLASGTVQANFHDTWDLDGSNYMPSSSASDEGYWELDGSRDIQPLDV